MEAYEIMARLAAPHEQVYQAWLNPRSLTELMGELAWVEPVAGGMFVARDGNVQGQILDLKPSYQILQTWWTADGPPGYFDSRLLLAFEPLHPCASLLTVRHTDIPDGYAARYCEEWITGYLDRMYRHFAPAELGLTDTMPQISLKI